MYFQFFGINISGNSVVIFGVMRTDIIVVLNTTRSKGSVNLPQGSVNLVVLCKVYMICQKN